MSDTEQDVKQLVEQIAAEAEATMNDPMPAGTKWTRPNKLVTVATRVSPEHLGELEELAEQSGVPVSALIRGWIIAGLNARQDESVQNAIERLSADLQRLRELVA
jgi:predicted DNA-binding protein